MHWCRQDENMSLQIRWQTMLMMTSGQGVPKFALKRTSSWCLLRCLLRYDDDEMLACAKMHKLVRSTWVLSWIRPPDMRNQMNSSQGWLWCFCYLLSYIPHVCKDTCGIYDRYIFSIYQQECLWWWSWWPWWCLWHCEKVKWTKSRLGHFVCAYFDVCLLHDN